jgi:Type I phosphodiesterase / nucleotide pyrophosphatase
MVAYRGGRSATEYLRPMDPATDRAVGDAGGAAPGGAVAASGATAETTVGPRIDPVRPAYGAGCLDQVVPTLLTGRAASWLPEPVAGAQSVVLLVLDGFGWNQLEEHRGALPVLGAMAGGSITSVLPSTTASALTSLATGMAPSQHGIVGFRIRIDDSVLNVLRWQVPYGRKAPDPFTVQRHTAFLGRSVPVVTKGEFRRTGFTEAHLRGSVFTGWSTVSVLVEHCRRLVGRGERLVYAYYPGVDSVAHEFGLHDEYYRAELAFADELVGRLLDELPSHATLVVTADHGQVHVGDNWLQLHPLRDMYRYCAGEGRFRYLYAERGAAPALLEAAEDEFGQQAWVFARDQLLDEGWLGPGPVIASIRRRIGDVILAPRDPVAFVDPDLPNEAKLIGAHGSLTPDEMYVPLLAARGRG